MTQPTNNNPTNPPTSFNGLINVTDFAKWIGVTDRYIKAEIKKGRLPATKTGSGITNAYLIRIDDSAVQEWINNPLRGSRVHISHKQKTY